MVYLSAQHNCQSCALSRTSLCVFGLQGFRGGQKQRLQARLPSFAFWSENTQLAKK